ncbi:NfeD family protein [Rhodopseudomonas sp. B29]|uniref:NfeD family protein n=1 Tax=Rhodopseudomonas sp. B29 TaxID=95607 RepID=UPI00034C6E6F|nr:NfeD family protein [Rhodopseudomonas sp. B29]
MIDLFVSLGAWTWLIGGFVLMALELLAPGMFLFWLGLAALLTGLSAFVLTLSWQLQLLIFALFSIAAVPLWRRMARGGDTESRTTNPYLNRRTEALVGREFTLEKPIEGGAGTVRIDDTVWRVFGPDTPAGSRVRIVAADGAQLTVAPV